MERLVRARYFIGIIGGWSFFFQLGFGQFLTEATEQTAASLSVKREFRGAWIATVTNLDWPPSNLRDYGSSFTQLQKDYLTNMLDQLAAAGFNAVVFQVRTECDAFYSSPYEPWSYWLTGAQGTAPSPFYDPLQFAVEEAHKRGMELHAWFNPYRAVRPSEYTRAPSHVSNTHPEWILHFSTGNILDPGLPAVRNYVATVVADIVRRYDVDGIHADDYFYPYPDKGFPGITHEDDSTYAHFNPAGLDRATWRRENIDSLLGMIADSVKAIKPYVKFGMSPFGIWKSGVPSGISGLDAYSTIYCDGVTWLQRHYIDYVAPQLYWAFGGGQDFGALQRWWADSASANGRHLYTGIATYRIGSSFSLSEIPNQINYNRGNPKVQGSIQFRAANITGNLGGINDALKTDVYVHASIIPTMSWKPDATPPNAPSALQISSAGGNSYSLQWTPPSPAPDGDIAMRYALYRFPTATPSQTDIDKGKNLSRIVGMPSAAGPSSVIDTAGVQYSYAVTSLDRNNNESGISNVVTPSGPIPTQPLLAYPSNADNLAKNGALKWNASPNALAYRIEFDSTGGFGPGSMLAKGALSDTTIVPTGLVAQKTYYWRVAAGNQVGSSGYSVTFSLRAGWPLPPVLISPVAITNVSRNPTLIWNGGAGTSFRVILLDRATLATVVDTTVADTAVTISRTLAASKIYGWKVAGINAYGEGDFSAQTNFKTQSGTLAEETQGVPAEYALSQNFPNPFNPVTSIRAAIPRQGRVSLRVYDILGREISTLLDQEMLPGTYTVRFDGTKLPSGIYIYVLTAEGKRLVNKMILVR
jgi:uncharacterized lipoprotein YddW (UPF0748 family)